MDLCGRGTALSEGPTGGFYLQHHLRALWEDEVIKEASAAGCPAESEPPQDGETNLFTGRSSGCLRRVEEGNFDELERRASFEEEY